MEEEEEGYTSKISTPEAIFIGLFFAGIDAVELFLLTPFALDDLGLLDALSSPIFLYLFFKGVPYSAQLIAFIAELFPWLGDLPLLTLGWGATVWADWNPDSFIGKLMGIATTAASVKGAAKGGAAGKTGEGAPAVTQEGTPPKGPASTPQETGAPTTSKEQVRVGEGTAGTTQEGSGREQKSSPQAGIPEEQFGVEPNPLEQLRRGMEEFPEVERPLAQEEEKKKDTGEKKETASDRANNLAEGISRTNAIRAGVNPDEIVRETRRRNRGPQEEKKEDGGKETASDRANNLAEGISRTNALRGGFDPDEAIKEIRRRNRRPKAGNDIISLNE